MWLLQVPLNGPQGLLGHFRLALSCLNLGAGPTAPVGMRGTPAGRLQGHGRPPRPGLEQTDRLGLGGLALVYYN